MSHACFCIVRRPGLGLLSVPQWQSLTDQGEQQAGLRHTHLAHDMTLPNLPSSSSLKETHLISMGRIQIPNPCKPCRKMQKPPHNDTTPKPAPQPPNSSSGPLDHHAKNSQKQALVAHRPGSAFLHLAAASCGRGSLGASKTRL